MKSPAFPWHKWCFTPRRAAICKAERVWALTVLGTLPSSVFCAAGTNHFSSLPSLCSAPPRLKTRTVVFN